MDLRARFTRVLLVACALPSLAFAETSLYDRLGGMQRITEVVSRTIDRTSGDPRTKRSFEGIRLAAVKESVALHLCQVAGGPCIYDGADMAEAHAGLAITGEEFDIMDAYLAEELAAHGVADAERAELQKLLGPMKQDVVGK